MKVVDAVAPIAVVGMAARFPGARDVDEYWRNLVDGRESISFWSAEQLRAAGVDEAMIAHPDYVPAAPVIPDVDRFDAGLFGMTRREAELCDPQLRIFLETCHAALENAGYDPFRMPDSVGVYGSVGPPAYLEHQLRDRPDLVGPAGLMVQTLNLPDYLATLVAYKLDLTGPAMTVLTACSSTLVAVHLAATALRAGECDAALAGGAVVRLPLGRGYLWTPGNVLSADGHCRPFDAEATGTIFGSGAGTVVLKRLEDAYADGDDIKAVILGSALNNDGADKVSFSAPSVSGQAAVLIEAMALAGVTPGEIGYVEAHATGTALGDPVEVTALTEAYRRLSEEPLPAGSCVLGAVKSNIGHLDAAAGIAGLVKAVLALQREAIPPTVHLRDPNPLLGLESTPFTLADSLRPWPRDPTSRRVAGVTSLGIGGTNAHLVLAEGPSVAPEPVDQRPRVVVWSAGSPGGERRLRGELAAYFRGEGAGRFADAVATLQYGRTPHRVRGAVVCESAAAAAAALTGAPAAGAVVTAPPGAPDPSADECPVAFLVTGDGDGPPRPAGDLYGAVRAFTVPMDECLDVFEQVGVPLYQWWLDGDPATAAPAVAEALRFARQYALAAMWRQAGVEPVVVMGDRLGELAVAAIAGTLALPDAAVLVARRAAATAAHPAPTAVSDPAWQAAARQWAASPNGLAVAIPPVFPDGEPADPSDPVRPGVLLRLGPGVAGDPPADAPDAAGVTTVASLGDGRNDRIDVLTAAAALWVRGVPIDWAALEQPRPGVRAALPGYPYERERYWIDPPPPRPAEPAPEAMPAPHPPALGAAAQTAGVDGKGADVGEGVDSVTAVGWVEQPAADSSPARREGTALVIVPDSPEAARRVVLAVQRAGLRPYQVRHGDEFADQDGALAVRPGQAPDLTRVLERLARDGAAPEVVVHAATCGGIAPGAALDDRLRVGFFSLLALSQAVLSGRLPALPRLVLVTSHSVDVSGGELVDPARTALHGLLRTVLAEAPDLRGSCLDVDERVDLAGFARELAGDGREPAVALRGRRRWLPVERPVRLPEVAGAGLRDQGVYLITGGTGGLGLAVAAGLAGTGLAPRIALLARRADVAGREAIEEIRARGAEVAAYPCDVTQAAAVAEVVDEITARWGPVHGVFHLAGLPGDRMVAFRDPADAAAVLAPKTIGTQVLEQVFEKRSTLDFAVFFGSRAATDGLVGGGDYAAANAYLDGASVVSPLAGGRVLSIGWPVWQGVGMAAAAGVDVGGLHQAVRRMSAPGRGPAREGPADGSARVWQREVSDATEWTLDEHRLGSVPLLPGTALIDLTVRGYHESVGAPRDRPVELRDIVFRAPLLDRAPRLLRITFRPAGEAFDVVMESRPAAGGDWSTHATAVIGPATAAEPGEPVDLAALRHRFTVAGQAAAAGPDEQPFTMGPRWRNITASWELAEERLLTLELPAAYHAELADHVLHPALLDTAAAGVRGPGHAGSIPFHYQRLVVHAPLPARFHAHVRRAEGTPAGDVDLLADDGSLLVRIEGFTMAAVAPQRLADPAPAAAPTDLPPSPPPGAEPAAGLAPTVGVDLLLRLLGAGVVGPVLVRHYLAGSPVASPESPVAPAGLPAPREAARPPVSPPAARPPVSPPAAHPAVSPPGTALPVADPPTGTPALTGPAPADGAALLERLRPLWLETLGLSEVEPDQDFFDAGGNSLTAVELMARVREVFGVELAVGVLLEARTFDDLVVALQERGVG